MTASVFMLHRVSGSWHVGRLVVNRSPASWRLKYMRHVQPNQKSRLGQVPVLDAAGDCAFGAVGGVKDGWGAKRLLL